MSGNFETWIGNRYVRSRSSNSFVSLISAISMLGIAIAVSVLILVLSVVNGFERELQDRLLTMTSHANIEGLERTIADWRALSEEGFLAVKEGSIVLDRDGLLCVDNLLHEFFLPQHQTDRIV